MANVLSDDKTTAGTGAGPARLVAAAHRGGDGRPAGDGERLPEGRRDRGAAAAAGGRAAGRQNRPSRGGVHRLRAEAADSKPASREAGQHRPTRCPPTSSRRAERRRRARASRYRELIIEARCGAAATRWRSGRTWSTTTASRGGYASVKRFVRKLRGAQAPEARAVIVTRARRGGAGRLRRGADGARTRRPASTAARGSSC